MSKGHEVFSAYKQHSPVHGQAIQLDLTDEQRVSQIVGETRPDTIVNAAAMTDVDLCESLPDTANLVNATSVGYLAAAAEECGSFLVQVSTDYVFSGDKGGHLETDTPNPINQYGLSKLKGEKAAMRAGEERWSIARASVVYGWGRTHRPNAATYVYDKLSKHERISMLSDQYSSPTLNTNLAGMLLEIAERRIAGIMHTSGATRLTRYDFAIDIARIFGLDEKLISPVESRNLNWMAKRPADSSLKTAKATRTLSNSPLRVEQALRLLALERASMTSL